MRGKKLDTLLASVKGGEIQTGARLTESVTMAALGHRFRKAAHKLHVPDNPCMFPALGCPPLEA